MYKTLTLKDSKRKSSRSKADLFELLVTLNLNQYYQLDTKFLEEEIMNLKKAILNFLNGNSRIEEQEKRAELLTPLLIKEINDKLVPKYGRPLKILWTGRGWQIKKSLSDIDIKFKSGYCVGVSLKSTRSGRGTQKNLGLISLKKYLSLDIEDEIKEMWTKIRRDLSGRGKKLREISQKEELVIRKNKYQFPIIQEIGKKYGRPIQKIAVEKSVYLFNKLSSRGKINFIKYIFGLEEIKPLINAGVQGKLPYLFRNESFNLIIKKTLKARAEDGKGYHILAGGKPIVRVQANFTNGIGLSAFCERAFLMEGFHDK